jgi:hypothetical protein
MPGSSLALATGLLVFGIKYGLAVFLAIHPEARSTLWFLVVDVGVTGLVAGVFAGRLFMLWRRYTSEASKPLIA